MSTHLTSLVYSRQLNGVVRKSVMVALADQASDGGDGIAINLHDFAAQLCTTPRTVRRVLRTFERDHLIRLDGTPSSTLKCAIQIAALTSLPLVKAHERRANPL